MFSQEKVVEQILLLCWINSCLEKSCNEACHAFIFDRVESEACVVVWSVDDELFRFWKHVL